MAKRKKGKPSLLAIIIFIVIALLGVKETGLVEIDNSTYQDNAPVQQEAS